ncbi:methyltransferase domain-containing protein [Dactylosporangium sp. NPDC051484]|uniref:class I SAM-dependent methyltransferase n=1 Tax=Dactylosporangium sp. NPDC051484 TaxID=3154942 RepID=UPI00344FA1D5
MPTARLALRAAGLILRGKRADPTPDYDVASTGYDDFFSKVMGGHGRGALGEVVIEPGDRVVELACGTGHLTEAVAEQLRGRGSIKAVDMSGGMLAMARKRLAAHPGLDTELEQGDMLAFIERQPSRSADLVVCGWAICYTKPARLLRQIHRVLVPGGRVVIIETRDDALVLLRDSLEAVLGSDPSMMTRMVHVSLPKNPGVLRRWFEQTGLQPLVLREGEQVLPWKTAEEAVEWVERSGAAAGFRDAIQASRLPELRSKLRDELHRRLVQDPTLRLTHTFVVGVAARPSDARR